MGKIKVENNAKNVTVRIEDDGNRVIIEQMPEQVELRKLKPGDKFKVGEFAFVKSHHGTLCGDVCILDGFVEDAKDFEFGDNNNYAESKIREYLNDDFYKKLEKVVGQENIKEFEIDLMSRDGLKDYGKCRNKVALLTERMYQDNREYLPATGKYWWLATPWSTPTAGYSRIVCHVCDDGTLSGVSCDWSNAVRPFCILKSNILVSLVDE